MVVTAPASPAMSSIGTVILLDLSLCFCAPAAAVVFLSASCIGSVLTRRHACCDHVDNAGAHVLCMRCYPGCGASALAEAVFVCILTSCVVSSFGSSTCVHDRWGFQVRKDLCYSEASRCCEHRRRRSQCTPRLSNCPSRQATCPALVGACSVYRETNTRSPVPVWSYIRVGHAWPFLGMCGRSWCYQAGAETPRPLRAIQLLQTGFWIRCRRAVGAGGKSVASPPPASSASVPRAQFDGGCVCH